jgi:hypothetical protein
MKRNQTLLGIILTLVGGCFWGLCGACAQYLFENENVTSNFLVPWRMTLAGLLLLTYHLIRSPKTILTPWKSGKDALRLIFYAIFGMAMCQYAYFATIELSNAGTATVLQYSAPAMLLIIVCFMERKLPTGNDILADCLYRFIFLGPCGFLAGVGHTALHLNRHGLSIPIHIEVHRFAHVHQTNKGGSLDCVGFDVFPLTINPDVNACRKGLQRPAGSPRFAGTARHKHHAQQHAHDQYNEVRSLQFHLFLPSDLMSEITLFTMIKYQLL